MQPHSQAFSLSSASLGHWEIKTLIAACHVTTCATNFSTRAEATNKFYRPKVSSLLVIAIYDTSYEFITIKTTN